MSNGVCTACGASYPVEPSMPAWCESCGKGAEPQPPANSGRVYRARQALARAAATRIHQRLSGHPDSLAVIPSRRVAVAFSVAILLAAPLVVLALVWLILQLAFWFKVVFLAILAGIVLLIVPRPSRLPPEATVLTSTQAPALWDFVAQVARSAGVSPPDTIAVDIDHNMSVMGLGYGRRTALILGLPLWTVQSWPERTATLAHEMGHLRGRDTRDGRLVFWAKRLLWTLVELLWPDGLRPTVSLLSDAGRAIGAVLQHIIVAPFLALAMTLERIDAVQSQHAEYLADRRAAQVAGSEAMTSALAGLLPPQRGVTAMERAIRQGEDPWLALEQTPQPTDRELRRRRKVSELSDHQLGDSHPPTSMRIALLERHPVAGGLPLPPSALRQVDVEMRAAREQLTQRLRDAVLVRLG